MNRKRVPICRYLNYGLRLILKTLQNCRRAKKRSMNGNLSPTVETHTLPHNLKKYGLLFREWHLLLTLLSRCQKSFSTPNIFNENMMQSCQSKYIPAALKTTEILCTSKPRILKELSLNWSFWHYDFITWLSHRMTMRGLLNFWCK